MPKAPDPGAPALISATAAQDPAPGSDQSSGLGSGHGSALPPAGDAALAYCAQQLLSELWQGSESGTQQAAALGTSETPVSSAPPPSGNGAGGGATQNLGARPEASGPDHPEDGSLGSASPDGSALRWLAALQDALATARAADKAGAAAFPAAGAPPRLGDAPAMVLAALLAHGSACVAGAAARAVAAAAERVPLAGISLLPVLLFQLQDRAARITEGELPAGIKLFLCS